MLQHLLARVFHIDITILLIVHEYICIYKSTRSKLKQLLPGSVAALLLERVILVLSRLSSDAR